MSTDAPEYFNHLADYSKKYRHATLKRDEDTGILEVRLHAKNDPSKPLMWGASPHTELGYLFADIGSDPKNRVIIITGTGNEFCADIDCEWISTDMSSWKWDKIYQHGKRLLANLLNIEVPVITAVNGPATIHAELAVMNDIVVCTDDTVFQDAPHFQFGTVPGDGVHIVWQELLGPNRGRYFLLTAEEIAAEEAKRLGVVQEVLSRDALMDRAWELARIVAEKPTNVLRYSREALTHNYKKLILDGVPYGLALEGMGAHSFWNTAPEGTDPSMSALKLGQ